MDWGSVEHLVSARFGERCYKKSEGVLFYTTREEPIYKGPLVLILFISLWVLEEGEKGLLSYDGLNETNDETANEKGAVDNVAAKELLLREVLMLDGEYGKHVGVFIFPVF